MKFHMLLLHTTTNNENRTSGPATSALLASSPPAPYMLSCLEVTEHATARLELPWQRGMEEAARGRLNESFLSGHNPPAPVSLPFLPDLHSEIEKVWKNPYSACNHQCQHANANIEAMCEHGCESMPPIEEMFASYLSLGETSMQKAPALPSKPLKTTSRINGRAYVAAGQAGAALHTIAMYIKPTC